MNNQFETNEFSMSPLLSTSNPSLSSPLQNNFYFQISHSRVLQPYESLTPSTL